MIKNVTHNCEGKRRASQELQAHNVKVDLIPPSLSPPGAVTAERPRRDSHPFLQYLHKDKRREHTNAVRWM